MSRRSRATVVVLSVLVALTVTEVVLHRLRGPQAQVKVENLGDEPIEGLEVALGASRAAVPRVEPGASVRVVLNGRGPQTLEVRFRQRGNPSGGLQLPGFDPGRLSRDGLMLILQVRPGEVVRYQDDAEPATP